MKKEILKKVRNEIIDLLDRLDINPIDKGELAINLYHFLDEEDYSNNIKALNQNKTKSLKPKKENKLEESNE